MSGSISFYTVQGDLSLISPEDSDLLEYQWHSRICHERAVYVQRSINDRTTSMHRIISRRMAGRVLAQSEKTDHINRNGLDNQRNNLRLVTHSQNLANMVKQRGKRSSIYKGVDFRKDDGVYRARIRRLERIYYLGNFVSELDAAMAYDAAARHLFGEFACLNFPK